jgi:nucleoside phosphorylase
VGPVDAAAATAQAIAAHQPAAIIHVGIAGARRTAAIEPPALVIGTAALWCDVDPGFRWAPRELSPAPLLLDAARRALPTAIERRIGTSAKVGGTSDCDVEAMEGYAVLRAALLAGIPAIEVRAISNAVEESDRAQWRFADAFAAIAAATPLLVAEVAQCVR